jgi:hypothetical protein
VEPKVKVIKGLQIVQTLISDTSNAVGDMVLPYRENRMTLAAIYDKLAQAENILNAIMEEDFWS